MTSESAKGVWPHIIAVLVLVAGFYSLVLYPYVLDDLVKGAIINMMGAAVLYEFGAGLSGQTSRQQQAATDAGAAAGAMVPTTTVSAGPPVTVTTTPTPPNGTPEVDLP